MSSIQIEQGAGVHSMPDPGEQDKAPDASAIVQVIQFLERYLGMSGGDDAGVDGAGGARRTGAGPGADGPQGLQDLLAEMADKARNGKLSEQDILQLIVALLQSLEADVAKQENGGRGGTPSGSSPASSSGQGAASGSGSAGDVGALLNELQQKSRDGTLSVDDLIRLIEALLHQLTGQSGNGPSGQGGAPATGGAAGTPQGGTGTGAGTATSAGQGQPAGEPLAQVLGELQQKLAGGKLDENDIVRLLQALLGSLQQHEGVSPSADARHG